MSTLVPYSTRVEGRNLYVLVGESASAPAAPAAPRPVAAAPAPVAAHLSAAQPAKSYARVGRTIENIDF